MASDSGPLPAALSIEKKIKSSHPSSHLQALAQTVLHNLKYQHDWTDLQLHTHRPESGDSPTALPRSLVSGIPPQQLYVHPDTQIASLAADKGKEEKLAPLREWVLPANLKERWSLKRFAEVFDSLPAIEAVRDEIDDTEHEAEKFKRDNERRILLGIVSDDSTIVYYIVHDGVVKPRQN